MIPEPDCNHIVIIEEESFDPTYDVVSVPLVALLPINADVVVAPSQLGAPTQIQKVDVVKLRPEDLLSHPQVMRLDRLGFKEERGVVHRVEK